MLVYAQDEQGVAMRDPLFLLLCQVIMHIACYDKAWKQ